MSIAIFSIQINIILNMWTIFLKILFLMFTLCWVMFSKFFSLDFVDSFNQLRLQMY